MVRAVVFLLPMLVLPICARSAGLVETNSKEMTAKIPDEGYPNHLTPAQWLPEDRECLAQFVSDESFHPTRALVLEKNDSDFLVRVWEIESLFDLDKKSKLIAKKMVPADVADLIYKTWVNALLRVQQTEVSQVGVDGATYFFATRVQMRGTICGQAQNPDGKAPPRWLADIGLRLIAYAIQAGDGVDDLEFVRKNCRKCLEYFAANNNQLLPLTDEQRPTVVPMPKFPPPK